MARAVAPQWRTRRASRKCRNELKARPFVVLTQTELTGLCALSEARHGRKEKNGGDLDSPYGRYAGPRP
jgi:hypothetical protein